MIGTMNCVYETPCGWCSKWDKECDKKMRTTSYRRKHPQPIKPIDEIIVNKVCKSEDDHEWECTGMSTAGITYTCKKCFAHKTETYPSDPYNITVSI